MSNAEIIGQCIRERRREIGISQNSLAARAGISPAALSKIENGKAKRITLESAEGIAFGLRISVDEIARAARGPSVRGNLENAAMRMISRLPDSKLEDVIDIMEKWVDDGKAKR